MMTEVAFVLCAGLGERLRPMTLSTPKPLMPIWNIPLLAHTLEALAGWGVREVYLNTFWLPEQLEAFVANYKGPLSLTLLHEREEVLGTGGGLRALAPYLKGRPFWLVNGDVVFDLQPDEIEAAFEASGRFAAAWLEPKAGPRTVETDYQGRVTCWHSPTPKVEHTATFAGVSLLSPEVLDFLPAEKRVCSVIEAFEAAMFAGKFVRGASPKGTYWNDAGTPEAYLQVHKDAQRFPALARYTAGAQQIPGPEVKRALELLKWAAAETVIVPLGRRGSKRTFWRLVGARRSVIAIAYETEGRAENGRYAACAEALTKAGIPVPKVVADQPGLLLMEDFGDRTLDKLVKQWKEETERAGYKAAAEHAHHHEHCDCGHDHEHHDHCDCGHEHHHDHDHCDCHHAPVPHCVQLGAVMELLAAFHKANIGDLPLEPPFDKDLYAWEVGLYEQFAAPLPPAAKAEWEAVRDVLLAEPLVLVHRDFQSTNVLWHKDRPGLIDFQGMRRGPALYDLASFFYDPYVDWGDALLEDALHSYAKASGIPYSYLRVKLPYAGIQRLMQAIGAYYRLASVGQPRFLKFVPIARERASKLAQAVGLNALAEALAK